MLTRYSSRRESISDSLLNKKLTGARSYDRLAGYFRSSIFEVAGEAIDSITGTVRIICNSDLTVEDVRTAELAKEAMRREWCDSKPEDIVFTDDRLRKLYSHLHSKKVEIRVLPDARFGLIHGKAGVITLPDGSKTSFIGSVNESKSAWKTNYELVWEDDSPESIAWLQEEFEALWNDPTAVDLSDFVIKDIGRIAGREVIPDIDTWRNSEDTSPAQVAIETPVFREQLGLWEHQKHFIDLAFKAHTTPSGARYILADQVGLGKTIQLALSAELMALNGDKPVLIIAPKTLLWQWQDELDALLALPIAVWDGKAWVDESGFKHPNSGQPKDILKCPRKIGIISQGLITSGSPIVEYLLQMEYECVIVDEAHRSRRTNLGAGGEHLTPVMTNLYQFLFDISKKTHSMLLATATPMQLYPIELWDLMNILSQKNYSVLGSPSSLWRNKSRIAESLDLIMGKRTNVFANLENWDWLRNPFPDSYEDLNFKLLRQSLEMPDSEYVCSQLHTLMSKVDQRRIGNILDKNFYANYNPYIRHIVRRERIYLEDTINPNTNAPYLQRIKVDLNDKDTLSLTGYMADAYELAEEFCKQLGVRVKCAGFIRTLLLRRIGSSMEAGKATGQKMLKEWGGGGFTESVGIEDDDNDDTPQAELSELKDLTQAERILLERYVTALERNTEVDPKFTEAVRLLKSGWLSKGVIIFSQYFDTARWVAQRLSTEFSGQQVALYAGGEKSGVYIDGAFKRKSKDDIKAGVKAQEFKILVGTDSASEGLNLQTLGTLINFDLPWNPTRLEQRKGRIQRIGQVNDTVSIFNMRYKDSVEDRVHALLSERLLGITQVFGQLPDTLEAVWIDVAKGDIAEANRRIDEVPKKTPFEDRYNQRYIPEGTLDWESCTKVLDKKEVRKYFESGW